MKQATGGKNEWKNDGNNTTETTTGPISNIVIIS